MAVTPLSCPRSGAGAGLLGPSCLVCHSAADSGGGVKTESGGLSPHGGRRQRCGRHGDRRGTGQGVCPRHTRSIHGHPRAPLLTSCRRKTRRAPSGRGRPFSPGPFPPLTYNVPEGGAHLCWGCSPRFDTPPPPDDLCWVPVTQEDTRAHACQARFLCKNGLSTPVLVNLTCFSTCSPKSYTDKAPKASGRRLGGPTPPFASPTLHRLWERGLGVGCEGLDGHLCVSCSGGGVREAVFHQGGSWWQS